jgi:guanosine-3',5'-bis(diphosphate) 3'-pyrophosphohydrolase
MSKKISKLYYSLEKNINKNDIKILKKAFLFAHDKYEDRQTANWELIIVYVLNSSLILIKISKNIDSIISCIFRKILMFSNEKEIEKEFWNGVLDLVKDITKISNIKYNDWKTKKNLSLFYDIFQQSWNDIRLFLIKICLRVEFLKNIWILENDRKMIIARETLDIYIPLIKNFSLDKYFSNIEDLCYKIIKPQEYSKIENILLKEKDFLKEKVKGIKKSLNNIAKRNKIEIEIEYRIKSIYSIAKKIENKKVFISWIYDLIALRVITNKKREAYNFLGLIHSLFKSKDNRIKDYISSPKPNWYQSIHTTVSDNDWYIFEIQIQTKEMYKFNIFWLASHSSYKWDINEFKIFPAWMKDYYSKQKKWLFKDAFVDSFDITIFTDKIICLTPTWEKIELPKDSTILDFAFKVHTEIWKKIEWAWVNWEYVEDLIKILKNWDKVHLKLSEKKIEYPVNYISFLKTNIAKRNFKDSFKNTSSFKIEELWKHLINEEMESFWYKSFSKMPNIIQEKVLKLLKNKDINEFYFNVWNWDISIKKIMSYIYNLKNDDTKYKSFVWIKIFFKEKKPENINSLFKVFHDLDINLININYKWIIIDTEVNVKNLSLLNELLVEISRLPNVMRVRRVVFSKLKKFIYIWIISSTWILISPIVVFYLQNHYMIWEFLYKSLFYINSILLLSLLYLFKQTINITLAWSIKNNLFWLWIFILNTFTLISVTLEYLYIFRIQNSVYLFSFVLVLYWLTVFEYLNYRKNKTA